MTPTRHQRLASYMDARRTELGLSWREVAETANVTVTTVNAVRRGSNEPSRLTRRGIERALQWAPGSVEQILRGGDPLPADHPPADPMGATEAILDDMERRVADMKRLSRRDLAAIDALIEALKNPDPNDATADNNHR